MASLNLRSKEPVLAPGEEIDTDETPPGLDAIRAWLRKPRPWLHGIRLWIRWIKRRLRRARKWAAENAVPAARRAAELAARGADAARAVAKAGQIAADAGKHVADMGRAWRNGDGRVGRMGKAIVTGAGQFRDFSINTVRSATSAAAVGDAVGRFRKILPKRPVIDAGPSTEEDDPGPTRLLVPVTHRRVRDAPPKGIPVTPEAPRKPAPETPDAPPEPLAETPKALPEPAPDPSVTPDPERPASPPARRNEPAETPPSSSAASLRKEARRAKALAELPFALQAGINALLPRTRKAVLWPLIVEIVRERGWTTSADLGLLLGVGHRNLARRHLGPMVEAGLLELRYPELASHRGQAYRVKSGPAPGS